MKLTLSLRPVRAYENVTLQKSRPLTPILVLLAVTVKFVTALAVTDEGITSTPCRNPAPGRTDWM